MSEIAESYLSYKHGTLVESEFRFTTAFSDLEPETLSLNPVHYLPQHNAALKKVIMLGEGSGFEIHRLGDIAKVYNGPRFKRPYADLGQYLTIAGEGKNLGEQSMHVAPTSQICAAGKLIKPTSHAC